VYVTTFPCKIINIYSRRFVLFMAKAMSTTKPDRNGESDLQLLYVLMQPTRQKIIKVLSGSKEPLYITEIASKIGENPRNVSFHLATLAEYGFVDGEYREIEKPAHHSAMTGRAGKFYRLTSKVGEVRKRLVMAL